MPRAQAAALILVYRYGLSQREVAETLGASLGDVKHLVALGLQTLNRLLFP